LNCLEGIVCINPLLITISVTVVLVTCTLCIRLLFCNCRHK